MRSFIIPTEHISRCLRGMYSFFTKHIAVEGKQSINSLQRARARALYNIAVGGGETIHCLSGDCARSLRRLCTRSSETVHALFGDCAYSSFVWDRERRKKGGEGKFVHCFTKHLITNLIKKDEMSIERWKVFK